MAEIIGVRFKNAGKIYYFDPCGQAIDKGQKVIVETARGTECGEVVMSNRIIDDKECVQPLKKVVRIATQADLDQIQKNREKEEQAFKVCSEKVRKHKLDMKLIDVEYAFDNNKILFYFTSEGRVDFRELVKDLASVLKTRIELRQIGVRDEAKMLGGIGICGQPFCCKRFLDDFQPVSIKMAKEQGLSLNPTKISGSCGRLMCCLKYEQDAYEYLNSLTPNVGATVKTPDGMGTVTDVNLISGNLFVRLNDSDTIPFKIHRDEVKLISRSRRKPSGENNKPAGKPTGNK